MGQSCRWIIAFYLIVIIAKVGVNARAELVFNYCLSEIYRQYKFISLRDSYVMTRKRFVVNQFGMEKLIY